MARAIGLDIGSRTAKVVEIDGSAKGFRVVGFRSKEYPGEGGGAAGQVVTDAVGELIREAKAARDSLVTAMNSGEVVIREILVPFLEDDQIRRVLRYEAEAHLHNYAIEDVVVDYVKVGEVKDQSKILIFAAPKDRVRERVGILNAHGVEPMNMTLDMAALFNAAAAVGCFDEHRNAVVLDMGATTTNILFVRDGELKSCRSLRSGSESITRVLAQDLAVDTDTAREKTTEGDGSPREDDLLAPLELDPEEDVPETERTAAELERSIVVQQQSDFLTRLCRETTRSIAAYGAEIDVDAIYLTGGASLAGGVKERLEERFGTPVIRIDFLGDGNHEVAVADHDQANAEIGVALGCALKGLGPERFPLEFRREDLRYTRKFDLVKVALATTVSLIFILLFLNWLNLTNEKKVRQREVSDALTELRDRHVAKVKARYREVLGDDAKRLPADPNVVMRKLPTWSSQVRAIHRHITSELGFDVVGVPPVRSALGVWKDLFDRLQAIRRELGYLYIQDFHITQKYVSFSGLIGNRGQVDALVQVVRRIDYVEDVERGRVEVDKKTNKFRFNVKAILEETKVERAPRGGR